MGVGRQLYNFLLASSQAYAKWDLEVSTSILKNRKKLLILLALLLPILAGVFAEAYEYHEMLGGKAAYAPAFYTTTIFLASIAVGLAAGLITGCIGAGGGFIITPALMAVGVKGILAVGTDLFHIFAKAIMGTTMHKKLGNVSVKLAIAFLIGSIGGTFIGGAINKSLYNADPLLSELFISTIYAVLLGFLGFYALFDFLKTTRGASTQAKQQTSGGDMTNLASKLQGLSVPPMITFDEDLIPGGRRISSWIVALGGVVVGLLAAIHVRLHFWRFLHDHSRHRYLTDHLHSRICSHRSIRHLRLCLLYLSHWYAFGLIVRHSSGCLNNQGRQRYTYSWFLRHVDHCWFYQPRNHVAQKAC